MMTRMPDRIAAVVEHLRASGVPFAVIGAAAMSTRGFPRQTLDLDILTTDRSVLDEEFWGPFSGSVDVRRGDADDPLLGVIRFRDPEIDVIVGRHRWQSDAVSRAEEMTIGEQRIPVVTLGDLMLLKLDAGGYRDAADVKMMLSAASEADVDHLTRLLPQLDERARRLWNEIRAS